MSDTKLPASQRAEESVLGGVLRDEQVRLEIMASGLEPEMFYFAPYRVIFEQVVERYYADDTIDPLLVGDAVSSKLAKLWSCSEKDAVDRVRSLTAIEIADKTSAEEHAGVVRRYSDYRELLKVTERAQKSIMEESVSPDEIAGQITAAATRIATGGLKNLVVLSHGEAGRRWFEATKREIAAREAGMELGVFFSIRGIDSVYKGLRATELAILGGEPGSGKSTIAWACGRNYARRQMKRDNRIGTLVLSMEMGEGPSGTRIAQAASGIDGEKLRMGTLSRQELTQAATSWAKEKDWPLYWVYSGELRETQLRAIVVQAVQRWNVGLVIIDHFRFIKTDEKFSNPNDADDQIVKFLKSGLAKELDVAVMCLAHTTKSIERADKRPRMSDLRGSGMISAFADFVTFVYHPYQYASRKEQDEGLVAREDYELIHDKSRMSAKATGEVYMDLSRMLVR